MRLWNWKSRLATYIVRGASEPYRFGQNDCAIFASGAVKAVCGKDPMAPYRGKYRTKSQGLILVGKDGFADHIAVFKAALDEIAPAFAAPGDVAIIDDPFAGPSLGVVQGEFVYALGPSGLGIAPRSTMTRALRT
ncbi:MAG: hypothetical protein JXR75_00230 [Rhodobacteraceae bacterium]|nr:hypothetical protein [Paracoccaceae bacterium]